VSSDLTVSSFSAAIFMRLVLPEQQALRFSE
jgi:hypothetical protein